MRFRHALLVSAFILSLAGLFTPNVETEQGVTINESTQIRLNTNIWLTLKEQHTFTKLELGDNKILDGSYEWFKINSIDVSQGTVDMTCNGTNILYEFRWSPNTHYAKSIQGQVTSFVVEAWYSANNTLRSVLIGTGSAVYIVYWENLSSIAEIHFDNGTTLSAESYYHTGTDLITVPCVLPSVISIEDHPPLGAPYFTTTLYLATVVGGGMFLAWWYRRKKKTRTVSVP